MAQQLYRMPALSSEDELFLQTVEDDTDDYEESPWMSMGDAQFRSASALYWSLRNYTRRAGLPWYVGAMLPIFYPRPRLKRKGQVAPDVLVSFVADRYRDSYDLEEEGVCPAFVLEVISSSSVLQDTVKKRRTYRLLGMQEYVLFAPDPNALRQPALTGYRRTANDRFVAWKPDAQGRLWSRVLELYLVAQGREVHALKPDGSPLLTPEQEAMERERETLEREREALERQRLLRQAEQEALERQRLLRQAEQEALERRRLEDEVARLRAELERNRHDS